MSPSRATPRRRRRVRTSLVEQIKQERPPLQLLDDLPRLAATPYEDVDENDVLRLQWLGLYHDKPKVGSFMLRVRLPGGELSSAQALALAAISERWGAGVAELTTRQDVQLHHVQLGALPDVFEALRQAGLSSLGACGDVLRNITACPLAGRHAGEVFDVRPDLAALVERFAVSRTSNLPRKHKWTLSACPEQCTAPELHDIGAVAVEHEGQQGFALRLGGGLSTVPRIARELGAFVPRAQLGDALEALLLRWSDDPRYRRSRGRARFKFLVDDVGPEALRAVVEGRLGPLPDLSAPAARGRDQPLGATPQRQPGRVALGVPVPAGLLGASGLRAIGELTAALGLGLRLTREQNLLLLDLPAAQQAAVQGRLADAGLPVANRLAARGIACTGDPFCNFALGATKPVLSELIDALGQRYGERLGDLRVYLDGCPHACGQHWVGDLGLQGTTTKRGGQRVPAFDLYLGGRAGEHAAIGEALVRKVPRDALAERLFPLFDAYLARRQADESFTEFTRRTPAPELTALITPTDETDR